MRIRRTLSRLPLVPALATAFAVLAALPAFPQPATEATLVEDLVIDPWEAPAVLDVRDSWNGLAFFVGYDDQHGLELWRTDGTEEGTFLLRDVCPGRCDSRIARLYGREAGTDEALYFLTRKKEKRPWLELWRTDGTPEGTRRIPGLPAGVTGNRNSRFHALGSTIVWAGWRTDGTPEGTYRLPFDFGTCSRPDDYFPPFTHVVQDGHLYFLGKDPDPVCGYDLWRTDGTTEGTEWLDICPGGCTVYTEGLVAADSGVYLDADDGVAGRELWRVPPGGGVPHRVIDLVPGYESSVPWPRTSFREWVYFFARQQTDTLTTWWRSDGTEEGTVEATELNVDVDRPFKFQPLAATSTYLLFGRRDGFGDQARFQLWKTEGPGDNLEMIFEAPLQELEVDGTEPVVAGNLVYLTDNSSEVLLWRTDGTTEGTYRLTVPFAFSPAARVLAHGPPPHALLGSLPPEETCELLETDGTNPGTRCLLDVVRPTASSDPHGLIRDGDGLLYVAGEPGAETLRSLPGGEAPSTALLPLEEGFAVPSSLGTFIARHGEDPELLLRTPDGELRSLFDVAGTEEVLPVDGGAYFRTEPFDTIFFTSGTSGSTVPLSARLGLDFFANGGRDGTGWLLNGEQLYFTGGLSPRYLMRTDGTIQGTTQLHRFKLIEQLAAFGDGVLFSARETRLDGHEYGVWTSDGTPGGTIRLLATEFGLVARDYRAAGDQAFFVLPEQETANELWVTDGTPAGTRRVRLLSEREAYVYGPLVAVGDRVFFVAWTDELGIELWVSDGTEGGTHPIEILPGAPSSNVSALRAAGGRVVFAADDRVHGVEPWISDGTPEGTVLLADVAPGPASSSPEGFTPVRNRIYFSADDGTHARELHVVEPPCPENAHCLQNGRYHVQVEWRDFEDRQGSGHPVPATDDSGIFWFFAPTNWEMLVKVLEGCNFNDHRWVFFAATTNVEYTVRVIDSWTGEIREYPNPLGHSAETVIDLEAFPCGDP